MLPEVEAAGDLGYDAIIVDDGWQTLVGERSKVFPRFQGKYLRYWEGQGAWELDLRYPDVRAHIIDTYRTAIRGWGVDGFRLMTDILAELRAVTPDVMIEFRQPYAGPKMRTYGNLLRATDSSDSTVANRWNAAEPVEAAALQLLDYPLVMAGGRNKVIAAAYADVVVPLDAGQGAPGAVDVLNAKRTDGVVLDVETPPGTYRFRVLDALGRVVEEGRARLDPGAHSFTVPPGGMLALEAGDGLG